MGLIGQLIDDAASPIPPLSPRRLPACVSQRNAICLIRRYVQLRSRACYKNGTDDDVDDDYVDGGVDGPKDDRHHHIPGETSLITAKVNRRHSHTRTHTD